MLAVIGLPVSGWSPTARGSDRKRSASLQVGVGRDHVLGQRGALGLLAVAELEIGAEPARAQRHVLAGFRVLPEQLRPRISAGALARPGRSGG